MAAFKSFPNRHWNEKQLARVGAVMTHFGLIHNSHGSVLLLYVRKVEGGFIASMTILRDGYCSNSMMSEFLQV